MATIQELYEIYISSSGITTDSRNCEVGTIFFALKGDNFNGNVYAEGALKAGCSYAVVDEKQNSQNPRLILVDNVLETLQLLARHHRRVLGTKIIGITGTNGKTTTKELIQAVCSSNYNTIATLGNLNNHIGVPLTLLRLTKNTEIGIIEMGANHVGEIALLSSIAEPNIGLITNVGKAHLEGFGSFNGIKKAKGELYNFLGENNGKILLNGDNPHLIEMVADRDFTYFSTVSNRGLVWCNFYKVTPFLELEFEVSSTRKKYFIKTNLVGSYNLENIIAAISIGLILEISPENIINSIATYYPQNNRSQLTKTESNTLLIDCYNANPSSMEVAIKNFKEIENDKKVAIIGEMLELGQSSSYEHQKLIESISTCENTTVYLVGKEFGKTNAIPSSFFYFQDSDSLLAHLKELNLKGKLILIKGSRGNKLEKTIQAL